MTISRHEPASSVHGLEALLPTNKSSRPSAGVTSLLRYILVMKSTSAHLILLRTAGLIRSQHGATEN